MKLMDIFTFIKPYYRQSQGRQWLVAIVAAGLLWAFTLLYQVYDGIDLLTQAAQTSTEAPELPMPAATTTVAQTPLFGTANPVRQARINTNLLLLGVFLAGNPRESHAVIASQGKEAKEYKVNDQLADGGKLQAVYRNHVQLERNGQLETLYLEWDKRGPKSSGGNPALANSAAVTSAADTSDAEDDSESTNVRNTPPPISPGIVPGAPQTPEAWQERIKEIREKYQNQFGAPNGEGSLPVSPRMPMRNFKGAS